MSHEVWHEAGLPVFTKQKPNPTIITDVSESIHTVVEVDEWVFLFFGLYMYLMLLVVICSLIFLPMEKGLFGGCVYAVGIVVSF